MSTITVHRIEDIARRHVARIAQIEAMPPQLARANFNAWDFDRPPFQHAILRRRRPGISADQAGLLINDGGDVFDGGEAAIIVPCARRNSYALNMYRDTLTAGVVLASSSKTVPYEFYIDVVSLSELALSTDRTPSWNIYIGDVDYNNAKLGSAPPGTELWQIGEQSPQKFVAGDLFIGPVIPTSVTAYSVDAGRAGPYPAGSRMTVGILLNPTGNAIARATVHVSVVECLRVAGGGGGGGGTGPGPGPAPGPSPGPGAQPPDWTEVF